MAAVYQVADFLHPLDLAARQQLERIPMLKAAVTKYQGLVKDRLSRQVLLNYGVRLGPRQLPTIHRMLAPICAAFGIPEPDLYLMSGSANAESTGGAHPAIIIYKGLLEDLAEDEIQAVLAHECGHIMAEHVLYRQISAALQGAGDLAGMFSSSMAMASKALQKALLGWYRKSELTADRAAVAYMGGPEPLQRALFRMLGVPKWMPGDFDIAEYIKQAEEFDIEANASKWDRFVMHSWESGNTHPLTAGRTLELVKWSKSEKFRQVQTIAARIAIDPGNGCPSCGKPVGDGWRFCGGCGNPVTVAELPSAGATS